MNYSSYCLSCVQLTYGLVHRGHMGCVKSQFFPHNLYLHPSLLLSLNKQSSSPEWDKSSTTARSYSLSYVFYHDVGPRYRRRSQKKIRCKGLLSSSNKIFLNSQLLLSILRSCFTYDQCVEVWRRLPSSRCKAWWLGCWTGLEKWYLTSLCLLSYCLKSFTMTPEHE